MLKEVRQTLDNDRPSGKDKEPQPSMYERLKNPTLQQIPAFFNVHNPDGSTNHAIITGPTIQHRNSIVSLLQNTPGIFPPNFSFEEAASDKLTPQQKDFLENARLTPIQVILILREANNFLNNETLWNRLKEKATRFTDMRRFGNYNR